MRPMRYREHRGCARPLSTRHPHVLDQVPFGNNPIIHCAGCWPARSTRIWTPPSTLGNTCDLHLLLGNRWTQQDSRTSSITCNSWGYCRHFLVLGFRVPWRNAPEFSKDCPLQSRRLSPPSLELGAHLYLQALRTVPLDSFVAQHPMWFIRTNRHKPWVPESLRQSFS